MAASTSKSMRPPAGSRSTYDGSRCLLVHRQHRQRRPYQVIYGPTLARLDPVLTSTPILDDVYVDDTTGEAGAAIAPALQFTYTLANGNGKLRLHRLGRQPALDNYALVDETPHNSDTDYVLADAADVIDTLHHGELPTTHPLNHPCRAALHRRPQNRRRRSPGSLSASAPAHRGFRYRRRRKQPPKSLSRATFHHRPATDAAWAQAGIDGWKSASNPPARSHKGRHAHGRRTSHHSGRRIRRNRREALRVTQVGAYVEARGENPPRHPGRRLRRSQAPKPAVITRAGAYVEAKPIAAACSPPAPALTSKFEPYAPMAQITAAGAYVEFHIPWIESRAPTSPASALTSNLTRRGPWPKPPAPAAPSCRAAATSFTPTAPPRTSPAAEARP